MLVVWLIICLFNIYYFFFFIFCKNSSVVHYDPAREDHKQFEQTSSEETQQEPEPACVDEKQPEDPVLPDVSQDKYYDANMSSLAELFGNKKQVRQKMFIKSISSSGGGISTYGGQPVLLPRELITKLLFLDLFVEKERACDVFTKFQGGGWGTL